MASHAPSHGHDSNAGAGTSAGNSPADLSKARQASGTKTRNAMHGWNGRKLFLPIFAITCVMALLYFGYNGLFDWFKSDTQVAQETSFTPKKKATPTCGTKVAFTLSTKKPTKRLSASDETLELGCGLYWQRGTGPRLEFRIDNGAWTSWGYDEVYGDSLPPVGESVDFRLAEGESGSVYVEVHQPKVK